MNFSLCSWFHQVSKHKWLWATWFCHSFLWKRKIHWKPSSKLGVLTLPLTLFYSDILSFVQIKIWVITVDYKNLSSWIIWFGNNNKKSHYLLNIYNPIYTESLWNSFIPFNRCRSKSSEKKRNLTDGLFTELGQEPRAVRAPVPTLSTTTTLYYLQKNIYIVRPQISKRESGQECISRRELKVVEWNNCI